MHSTGFTRTRIAPTPSGFLHAGNILSFIYTWGLARQFGTLLMLRIDDLDQLRASRPYIDDIFETLNYLGIPWDEGPRTADDFVDHFSQVSRLPLYHNALEHLKKEGHLFACSCSRSQIEQEGNGVYPGTCRTRNLPFDSPGVAWRLKTDSAESVDIKHPWLPPERAVPAPALQDFIVRKKDGFPSYQLASVVDDIHFSVDLVVRGNDLKASTVAQLILARRLPANHFREVRFVHHPLIPGTNDMKMSKSAGAGSFSQIRNENQSREEIMNLLGRIAGIVRPTPGLEQLMQALLVRWQSPP